MVVSGLFIKRGLKKNYSLIQFPSFIFIYTQLAIIMIDRDLQEKALEALQDLVKSHLTLEIMRSDDLQESDIIESAYEHLMVEALLGKEQVRKAFLMLHLSRNPLVRQQKMTESHLFQWISSIDITKQLVQIITTAYAQLIEVTLLESYPIPYQAQIKQEQAHQQEKSNNSTPLYVESNSTIKRQPFESPFINDCKQSQINDHFNIEDIIGCSQPEKYEQSIENSSIRREVMFYTHQQMMDELKLQLQATAKTAGSAKINHYQPKQEDIKVQNSNSISNSSSPYKQLFILSYEQYQLYNQERVLQESQEYGHFLNGDKIDQILDIFYFKDIQYIIVKWKPRHNGSTPKDSIFLSQILSYHCPHQLLAFYEQRFPL